MWAIPWSSRKERFQLLREVHLVGSDGQDRPFRIEWVREHRGGLVFKFQGVSSIAEAEPLEGSEVRVPLAERAVLPPGEYYHSDLAGCQVVDRASGAQLGVVTGFQEYGGPGLLEVERPDGRQILIPFARSICTEIDLEARSIRVDLPEGLGDLSA